MTLKPDNNVTGNAERLPVSSADVNSAWFHTSTHTICIHGVGLNKLQEGLHLANC